MTDRLNPDDQQIVDLCNKLGPVLSGHSIDVAFAALSEMLTFGLQTALEEAKSTSEEAHDKAKEFISDFIQAHILHIAKSTGASLEVVPLAPGSDAIN